MNAGSINILINTLKLSFLLLVVAVAVYFASFSVLINEPLIASAVTFDLLITLPIAYWLFIRKTKISTKTVPLLVSAGFLIAMIILPNDNRTLFNYFLYYALPFVEVGFLTYAGFLIYRSQKRFSSITEKKRDFSEKLRETLTKEFDHKFLAAALAFEISGIYYALVRWRIARTKDQFTYHRKNGIIALLVVFAFIVAAETLVFHFLISRWSVIAAWILTVSSLYLLFQIIAHTKAMIFRPIEITDDKLLLRCGLMGDAAIDLENIRSVSTAAPADKSEEADARLLPLGEIVKGNVMIQVENEERIIGIYGKIKPFRNLELYVDEADGFIAIVEKKLAELD
ncbi:MAG: hypothetical protein R2681_02385 [Pyrinomonadaceae bacterium]